MALRQEDRHAITEILNQTPDIPEIVPVGALPAQSRRADARDGHRRGARLHVLGLRRRSADADQRRHPAPPGAAGREQPPPHRAAATRCCSRCPARRSSTTATRSGWATTSISAIATACGRRCSGAAIATAASRAPIRRGCTRRRFMDPVYGYQAINVEAQERYPFSLLNWMKRLIAHAQAASGVRPRLARVRRLREPEGARLPAPRRARNDPRASPTCRATVQPAALDLRRSPAWCRWRCRADGVPADRRPAVFPHARPLCVRTGSRCSSEPIAA